METTDRPLQEEHKNTSQKIVHDKIKNPFENQQSAEKDIKEATPDLEKEQTFKEAQTERD